MPSWNRPGTPTPLGDLFTDTTATRPRRSRRWAMWWAGTAAVAVTTAALLAPFSAPVVAATHYTVTYWNDLPDDVPDAYAAPQRTVLLDRNGHRFAMFYAENRVPINRDRIPTVMIDALTAVEDARFFDHTGVDFQGMARAAVNNASGGDRQGGSTITQQWIKNALAIAADTDAGKQAATEVSLLRKLREAKLAIIAERTLSKDDIITHYLNTAYFGSGAYGIYAAAKHYFSIDPMNLSVPQAALLAGLVQAPDAYNPIDNPDLATQRRAVVLDRMAAEGHLTTREARRYARAPLALKLSNPANGCGASAYPFYCQYVRDTLLTDPAFGATEQQRRTALYRGGWTITTALSPRAQRAATAAARRQLHPSNRVATATATVIPTSGELVALATNRRYGNGPTATEIVYANTPIAPPGSTFKPFVLATALEQGFPLSTRLDTPTNYYPATMNAPQGGFRNASNSNEGSLDAYGAARKSVNTWFVQLIERTGTHAVADFTERLGVTTLPRTGDRAITADDAALALGSYEMTPIELAGAYATFANHGTRCTPHALTSAHHSDGTTFTFTGNCTPAIPAAVADTVTDVLKTPFQAGGTAHNLTLPNQRPAAGKTGTTNGSAATWFAGYTRQYVTTVWVGDPRGGYAYPLTNVWAGGRHYPQVYGASIAGPIWRDTMTALHRNLPNKPLADADPSTLTGSIPTTPNLTGLTVPAAMAAAQQAGYTVKLTDIRHAVPGLPADMVATQQPQPGTPRNPGDHTPTVTITPTR